MTESIEVAEFTTNIEHTPLEYVYVTIPAEYICVYHRILVMLADYGVEMLKDCKASCKDRNSGVIECFNMFNAAVAARKLGGGNPNSQYTKEADLLIKYIKTKINQIYKNQDNSTDFVFPIDENGQLKAFVSCGELPKFYINPANGQLYEHKFGGGFPEHFVLGDEDYSSEDDTDSDLTIIITPEYERQNDDTVVPCANVTVVTDDEDDSTPVNTREHQVVYYFDGVPVTRFQDVTNIAPGNHTFEVVITRNGKTYHAQVEKYYNGTNTI